MIKQLKTMNVNDLLEELGACNSASALTKLKAMAESELDGQDDVTREVIMKVLHYKQYLICQDEAAFSKLIRKNWRLANDSKIALYGSAIDFFKEVDVTLLINALDSYQRTIHAGDTIQRLKISKSKIGLKEFEGRFLDHVIDTRDAKRNRQHAMLSTQQVKSPTA